MNKKFLVKLLLVMVLMGGTYYRVKSPHLLRFNRKSSSINFIPIDENEDGKFQYAEFQYVHVPTTYHWVIHWNLHLELLGATYGGVHGEYLNKNYGLLGES